jgi:hypothetical protein
MQIGYFRDLVFEVSDEHILSFSELTQDASANWSEHASLAGRSLAEFSGIPLSTLSFEMIFHKECGVDVATQIAQVIGYLSDVKSSPFVVNGLKIGEEWVVTGVSVSYKKFAPDGSMIFAKAQVKLKEYF